VAGWNGWRRLRVIFFKLLFLLYLNDVPRFLAVQAEAFVDAGLSDLMTTHSQAYPQLLGISRQYHDLRGLPAGGGKGKMSGY